MFAPILPSPTIPICIVFSPSGGCFEVTGVVPEQHCRLIPAMLVAERSESCRAEEEVPGPVRREPEPPCRQDPKEVSAGEDKHVPGERAHPLHDAIRPRSD